MTTKQNAIAGQGDVMTQETTDRQDHVTLEGMLKFIALTLITLSALTIATTNLLMYSHSVEIRDSVRQAPPPTVAVQQIPAPAPTVQGGTTGAVPQAFEQRLMQIIQDEEAFSRLMGEMAEPAPQAPTAAPRDSFGLSPAPAGGTR